MTGEDLYNLWAEGMEAEGVDVDCWEALEAAEVAAWLHVARNLGPRPESA